MSQNLQKVEINGKKYSLDLNKAIELGVLQYIRTPIKQFQIGDVFLYGTDTTRTDLFGIIVQVNIDSNRKPLYALLGAGILGLSAWSLDGLAGNYELSYNEMMVYLNSKPYTFCKNIGNGFNTLLQSTNLKLPEKKPVV